MKVQFMAAAVLLSLATAGYTRAAEKTVQQQKMTVCNQQAGEKALKGDVRKSFMSGCLKKEDRQNTLTPQQMKMKTCNGLAAEKMLKGAERKGFMSSCLKKTN